MAQGLTVEMHRDRGVPVLRVSGDLDHATAAELRQRGRALVDAALAPDVDPAGEGVAVVVLDAAAVDFVDSAGLGAVVDILKRARSHRAGFSVAGAHEALLDRLAQTGLQQVVALHASAADAVDDAVGDRPARR